MLMIGWIGIHTNITVSLGTILFVRGGGNFVCVRFNWAISGLKFHQPCGVPFECLRRVVAEEKVLLHSGVDFLLVVQGFWLVIK